MKTSIKPELPEDQGADAALREDLFLLMDAARTLAGISVYRLCQAAGVHQVTYSRLKKRPHSWQRATMRRLIRSLLALNAINQSERDTLAAKITAIGNRPAYKSQRQAA